MSDTKLKKSILTEDDESVSIREIKNGFIISRSWTDGKGDFKNEETFTEEKPDIGIS